MPLRLIYFGKQSIELITFHNSEIQTEKEINLYLLARFAHSLQSQSLNSQFPYKYHPPATQICALVNHIHVVQCYRKSQNSSYLISMKTNISWQRPKIVVLVVHMLQRLILEYVSVYLTPEKVPMHCATYYENCKNVH